MRRRRRTAQTANHDTIAMLHKPARKPQLMTESAPTQTILSTGAASLKSLEPAPGRRERQNRYVA
jgi:hypothetical protein